MYQTAPSKVIDLTPYLRARSRQARRREWMYTVLALWSQYLSLGALLLYGLLRAAVCPHIPLGAYSGPLAALWPASFLLLLISYVSDLLLWREG